MPCLEQVFSFGYRSSRLFGKNFYLWDYLGESRGGDEAGIGWEARLDPGPVEIISHDMAE